MDEENLLGILTACRMHIGDYWVKRRRFFWSGDAGHSPPQVSSHLLRTPFVDTFVRVPVEDAVGFLLVSIIGDDIPLVGCLAVARYTAAARSGDDRFYLQSAAHCFGLYAD